MKKNKQMIDFLIYQEKISFDMKKIMHAEYDCKLEFIGDESSLNNLREKISEMIKNKQKRCFEFLLGNEFDDMEDGDFRYSIWCGYAIDHNLEHLKFEFTTSSIIIKLYSCCLWDTLPYYSKICVKYGVDCQMSCSCFTYGDYDFYILYKNGKYKHRHYDSVNEGAYMIDSSSIYDKIKDDLMYDIRKNQINMNIKDIYLERYKYLKQPHKKWMIKLIDDIIASYSGDILFRSLHYEEFKRGY